MKGLITFVSGLIFSFGLGLSGMTEPHIVRGFLDITGNWDWRMLGVMAGAIAVHGIAFRLIAKRSSPVLETKFHLPTKKDIDQRLIFGALIFGLGWGWAGVCPGPGLVSLMSGNPSFLLFVLSMFVGMKTFQLIENKLL